MAKTLIIITALLFIAGCQKSSEQGKIFITTPSDKKLALNCPGDSNEAESLCQETFRAVSENIQDLQADIGCSNYRKYYTKGFFMIDNQKKRFGYGWGCGSGTNLIGVFYATKEYAEAELGQAAGRSTTYPPG